MGKNVEVRIRQCADHPIVDPVARCSRCARLLCKACYRSRAGDAPARFARSRITPRAAALVLGLGLAIIEASCGGNVTVEGGAKLNVCACWVAREVEAKQNKPTVGPCLSCWVKTIGADQTGGNGSCHYDQERCLADVDCLAISACVQGCLEPECMNACLDHAGTEIAHDLFMDWSRCFCTTCFDECNAYDTKTSCSASE